MTIKKYFINNKSYVSFEENLKSDYLALEIKFNSLPNIIVYDLNKILQIYQIKITKYLDGSYIKSFFDGNKDLSEMS